MMINDGTSTHFGLISLQVPLEDFQAVKFEWTNLAVLGARDVYLITQE